MARCLAAIALFGLACGHVQHEQPIVEGIRISGAKKVDESGIKQKILTTETPWWGRICPIPEGDGWSVARLCPSPLREVHLFDANAWQADIRRIERFYQAEGFYQAQVLSHDIVPKGDGVRLLVNVREGEPTTIGTIDYRGIDALPREQRGKALANLPLREGRVFLEEDWDGVKQQIQTALRELGYAEAVVEGEVEVDVATRKANVVVEITPGQRYKFGTIFIAQDPKWTVPRSSIKKQAEAAIKPTDWYSESALADAQARVFKMGVFGGVKVTRGAPNREAGRVPVVVDVREAPMRSLRAGGGVAVDQNRNEARGIVEYTSRNFFGGLRRATGRVKAGYAIIPGLFVDASGSQPRSGPIGEALAEFEQPQIFKDFNFILSLGGDVGVEQAYQFWSTRAKVGGIWQPLPEFSVSPSVNAQFYNLSNLLGSATSQSSFDAQALGCIPQANQADCKILLTFLEVLLEYDRRDDRAAPKNGYYVGMAFQLAASPFSGLAGSGVQTFNYVRFQPEGRVYKSFLHGDLTLAGKVKFGSLVPVGGMTDSPIVSRFLSGGGSSMRGFASRRLSPMQKVDPLESGSGLIGRFVGQELGVDQRGVDTVAIGGNGLWESSFEVRYRLTTNFVGALFCDQGFVFPNSLPLGQPLAVLQNLLYAVGFGFRYLTPVGPLRLDLAYRLPFGPPLPITGPPSLVPQYDSGCFGWFKTGSTTYGGAPEPKCQFHLSIGEAF